MSLYNNRYEKIRYLGKGVTGEVTLVKDQKTGLHCALKVLHAPLGHVKQYQLESLRSEFQILKNLNHPSVAKVYDTGLNPEDNRFYLVSEFIDGKDLFIGTEGISFEIIEDLFVQALRALNYLHSQQVYHFDIKPNNLLVTKDKDENYQLKIIDFGFANFYEQEFAKNRSSESLPIVGTPAFMAPEIIKKEPHDQRADLYSLACSFYKAFTRKLPFSGSQDEVYQKQLSEVPKLMSELVPAIPSYLDSVFMKLLEKEPSARYSFGQEVIKDLNFHSKKDYEVETFETAISYLPQRGKLVGREQEFERFKKYFADRLYLKNLKKKPYLVIHGSKGTGKTRFLEECKHEAYQYFIQVLTQDEAASYSIDQTPNPSLVIGDDITIVKHIIEYYEIGYQDIPILFVFTTSQKDIPCNTENIIELKNFTREQTEEYLLKAMGLSNIDSKDLEDIFKMTNGSPGALSGVVRILFKNRKIRDGHGNWSQKIYEDLGLNLEETGVEEFIKQGLREELEALNLDLGHSQVLSMLALAGKPTLNDLQSMSGNFTVDEALLRLTKAGILRVDAEDLYVFTNPLYKEIILEKMDPHEKADYCDAIADYYESQKANQETILYFKGRGSTSRAASSLLELAKTQRDHAAFHLAQENLELLLKIPKAETHLKNLALLEMGEIYLEVGKYKKAESHLAELVNSATLDNEKPDRLTFLKAIEKLGLAYQNQRNFEMAEKLFKEGLEKINTAANYQWLDVSYKSRLAQNAVHLGQMDRAEKLFNEAWNTWKNKLNDEEKVLAINTDIDVISYLKGNYPKAIGYLEEFLKILSKTKKLDAYPIILYRLGSAHLKNGNLEQAEEKLKEALDIVKERKITFWLYKIYNELGNLFEKMENYNEALKYYKHAYDLFERSEFESLRYLLPFNIAKVYFKMDNLADSEKYFNISLNLIRDSKNEENAQDEVYANYHEYISLLFMTDISRQRTQFQEADKFLEEAYKLLQAKTYLKASAQLYWQRKATLEKSRSNEKSFNEAVKNLEALKAHSPDFNEAAYTRWKKSLES